MLSNMRGRRRRVIPSGEAVQGDRRIFEQQAQVVAVVRMAINHWVLLSDVDDIPEETFVAVHSDHLFSVSPSVANLALRVGEYALRRPVESDGGRWHVFYGGSFDHICESFDDGSIFAHQQRLRD